MEESEAQFQAAWKTLEAFRVAMRDDVEGRGGIGLSTDSINLLKALAGGQSNDAMRTEALQLLSSSEEALAILARFIEESDPG